MSRAYLPPGLLDLVLARTLVPVPSARGLSILNSALQSRFAHSAAAVQLQESTSPYAQVDHSLYAQINPRRSAKEKQLSPYSTPLPRPPLTTLEEQLRSLKNTIVTEEALSETPIYSEIDLISLYEDLLALPAAAKPDEQERLQREEDESTLIVHSTASRLLPDDPPGTAESPEHSLAQGLRQLQNVSHSETTDSQLSSEGEGVSQAFSTLPTYIALISRLQHILPSVQTFRSSLSAGGGQDGTAAYTIPVGLMVEKEWMALVRYCLLENDPHAAEEVVKLMQRSGIPVLEQSIDEILAYYVKLSDVEQTQHFVDTYLKDSPTELQRDLHVKVYVKTTPITEFPTRALELLHDYESRALPAPQRTYSRIITHLLSNRTAVSHAQAWDLFSHMRYVAHPDPDAVLYTTMIRACASPSLSARGEPERALDLFTEMTVDKRMPPTAGAYTAVILACARSGSRSFVHEAFRLAKQMLDAHRDARGASPFAPDRRLYCALLEGAKRLGDLPRARWILAEMVREHSARRQQNRSDEEHTINEDVMMHVFHTYAAYRPPFQRSHTVIVDGETIPTKTRHDDEDQLQKGDAAHRNESKMNSEEDGTPVHSKRSNFPALPPQTHADVLREADALFTRITGGPDDGLIGSGFEHVQLTPRLLNAYLSVYYAHAALDKALDLSRTLFANLGVTRNAWSYVDALERCARAQKPDRKMALQFAQELWKEWEPVEAMWRLRGEHPVAASVNARLVERMYAAMVRTLSLCGQLDSALEQVRRFVRYYPPSVIREPAPKPALRSTRTSLVGAMPLVRVTSATQIPDDAVPPMLSFTEIEVLHHKLVTSSRQRDIGFLKWMCKAYDGSLRMRRERSLHALPQDSSSSHLVTEAANEERVEA